MHIDRYTSHVHKFIVFLLLACSCAATTKPSEQANLFIWYESSLKDDAYYIQRAANWWNNKLGCRVFALHYSSKTRIVFRIKTAKEYPTALAVARKYRSKSINYYTIDVSVITPNYPTIIRKSVFKHELGHVLGLNHTSMTDLTSIMHPYAFAWDNKGKKVAVMSDKSTVNKQQLNKLKKLYCKGL